MIRITGWRARTVIFGVLLLVGMSTLGCGGVGPDEKSGRDQARAGAQPLPVERVVTDTLNQPGGDSTDWKLFSTETGGTHTIEVFWDIDFVRGSILVTDQYGTRVASLSHDADRSLDQLVVELPEAGSYYLKLNLTHWYSTYSVRVYPGSPRETEDWVRDPRPEFDREI